MSEDKILLELGKVIEADDLDTVSLPREFAREVIELIYRLREERGSLKNDIIGLRLDLRAVRSLLNRAATLSNKQVVPSRVIPIGEVKDWLSEIGVPIRRVVNGISSSPNYSSIFNILSGKVDRPRRATVEKVVGALSGLLPIFSIDIIVINGGRYALKVAQQKATNGND